MIHYEYGITANLAWLKLGGYTKNFRDYIEELIIGEYITKLGLHSVKKCYMGNEVYYEATREEINENMLDKIVRRENLRPDDYYKAIWYAYGREDAPVCSPFDDWVDDEVDIIAQALFKNLWDTCDILIPTLHAKSNIQVGKIALIVCPIVDKTVKSIQSVLAGQPYISISRNREEGI